MDTKKKIATIIAATAAIAFTTAPLTATVANAGHKVKCYGVNSCKGKSKCKTAQNGCKGKNSCKGKGYVMKTEKECKKIGGSTTEPTTPETTTTTTGNESSSTSSTGN